MVFNGVQITGAGDSNVTVKCGTCGVDFEAAPGDSVRLDTNARGFLQVRRIAREASRSALGRDTEALRRLESDLRSAVERGDSRAAASVLSRSGLTDAATWLSPQVLSAVIGVLLAVLGIILTQRQDGEKVTPDQIDRLIDIEEQRLRIEQERLDREQRESELRRNQFERPRSGKRLCPCGSGKQFKRCHGLSRPRP